MRSKTPVKAVPQAHGADVYDAAGEPQPVLDFSSTVVSLEPPRGWRRLAEAALQGLRRYPSPHGRGLDAALERALGLGAGTVLVSNGASEALEWCARLCAGRRARLVTPCFGEYRAKLERAGAGVDGFFWRPFQVLDVEALAKGLKPGDQIWLANPGNPFGQILEPEALASLERLCAEQRLFLVLDEALMAQRLDLGSAQGALAAGRRSASTICVRSLGKGLGLPGLRLGYLAADAALTARLRRFQDPWSVHSMAQAMGAWAFEEEQRLAGARRRALALRTRDLLQRLADGGAGVAPFQPRSTGYFCLNLGAPVATRVADVLLKQGFLVRDCSSFGSWGRSSLRLNPRSGDENRALTQAFFKAWDRA